LVEVAVLSKQREILSPNNHNWLLVPLVGGVLLAGCGGSGTAATRTSPAAKSTTKAAPPTTTPAKQPTHLTLAAAVAVCKRGVKAAPGLSANTKSELEGICDIGGNGTPQEALNAIPAVCKEVAEASPLTTESSRKKAVSKCEAAATP
jgi:hypothetical protein